MKDTNYPHASIIIVNWNGKRFLEKCLDSVIDQTHPNYSVIVVDNASQDGSQDLIRSKYPEIILLENKENLGFVGGNNKGIDHAISNLSSEIVVVLNNDTWVEEDWLENLVKHFDDNNVGIVTSTIFLYSPYIIVSLKGSGSLNNISLADYQYRILTGENRMNFSLAKFPIEMRGETFMALPVDTASSILQKQDELKLSIDYQGDIEDIKIGRHVIDSTKLSIPTKLIDENLFEIIQNAGTKFNQKHYFFYEEDFLSPVEIIDRNRHIYDPQITKKITDAGCGCAMGIRSDLIKEYGAFKSDYFMYNEDTELSYRFLKNNYKTVLAPDAIVHHYFWGSTEDKSPIKIYYGTRNRLKFIKEYFGHSKFAYQWLRGFARAMIYGAKFDKISFTSYLRALKDA